MIIKDFTYIPHRDTSKDIEEVIAENKKLSNKKFVIYGILIVFWVIGLIWINGFLASELYDGLLLSSFFTLVIILLASMVADAFDKPTISGPLKYSRRFQNGRVEWFELTYNGSSKGNLKEIYGHDKQEWETIILPNRLIEVVEDDSLKRPVLNLDEWKVYIPHDIKQILLEEYYVY